MADQFIVMRSMKFTCDCGAVAETLDEIGVTDRHELYARWICPACGKPIGASKGLADLWRDCPPSPGREVPEAPLQEESSRKNSPGKRRRMPRIPSKFKDDREFLRALCISDGEPGA